MLFSLLSRHWHELWMQLEVFYFPLNSSIINTSIENNPYISVMPERQSTASWDVKLILNVTLSVHQQLFIHFLSLFFATSSAARCKVSFSVCAEALCGNRWTLMRKQWKMLRAWIILLRPTNCKHPVSLSALENFDAPFYH